MGITPVILKHKKDFKELFDNYSQRLYQIACRHIAPSDAEDIVQDIFVEIWERRDSIKIRSSWDGYLFAVLKHRVYRFWDEKNRIDESLSEALLKIGDTSATLSFEQLYVKLDETLNALPEKCRVVFEHRYYKNKKIPEIADEMDISVETVKTHLKRGFKLMRLNMKESMANFFFL